MKAFACKNNVVIVRLRLSGLGNFLFCRVKEKDAPTRFSVNESFFVLKIGLEADLHLKSKQKSASWEYNDERDLQLKRVPTCF